MTRNNVYKLIWALIISISAISGQYLHIDKRIVMLLGLIALLAWVVFLSVMLLGKLGSKKAEKTLQ